MEPDEIEIFYSRFPDVTPPPVRVSLVVINAWSRYETRNAGHDNRRGILVKDVAFTDAGPRGNA